MSEKEGWARLWLPVVFWAALIFAVSQWPHLPSPLGQRTLRKAAHIFEYAVFVGLLARGFMGWGRAWLGPVWAFAVAALFAASDELHQLFIPGRVAAWKDFKFDLAGILLGLTFYLVARHGKTTRPAFPPQPGDDRAHRPGLPPRA